VWNVETTQQVCSIAVHSDTIFSLSWNRDGSLLATTCKDKKIRVIDPRQGTVIAVSKLLYYIDPRQGTVIEVSKCKCSIFQ